MSEKINLMVILGTNREGRHSEKVAKFIEAKANEREGFKVTLVDVKDYPIEHDGGSNEDYNKLVAESDAFVVVAPEYNHSFPGSLKRLLDSDLKNYIHKPATIAGVSAGGYAGTRVIQSLVLVLREFSMTVSGVDITVGNVASTMKEDNTTDDEILTNQVKSALEELEWLARTMKDGIDNRPNRFHKK